MKKVELLAPAKNLKAIKAGLPYADAFYFGAKKFNMRMQADNFSDRELDQAIKMCHDSGKKAYFVSNILVYENELTQLYNSLAYANQLGFDAAIVNDLSAIQYAKDIGIPFHVSTQQNVSNSVAAKFFENLGAERIILARECSLKRIKEIAEKLQSAEIEAFAHGAMCTSISGRCYFSMDACGSEEYSANRGRCVQPCRREWRVFDEKGQKYIYDGVRFMNSRDLCMVEYIPEMIGAGIASLKIEGRMREPHYVEVVTKIYRQAIDAHYHNTFSTKKVGKWIHELKKVYNRGFTNGFYLKRATQEDQQHTSPTNLSHWRMIEMGSILRYSKKRKKALVELTNGYLKNGLEVIVQGGNRSNTYFHQKINSIEVDGRNVPRTKKGSYKEPLEVWIDVDHRVNSNKDDRIYLFTDSTYKNRFDRSKKKKRDYYKL